MSGMKLESKKKWLKVLKPEMTSSEESEEEVILIQYLVYRSPRVKKFFLIVDKSVHCQPKRV